MNRYVLPWETRKPNIALAFAFILNGLSTLFFLIIASTAVWTELSDAFYALSYAAYASSLVLLMAHDNHIVTIGSMFIILDFLYTAILGSFMKYFEFNLVYFIEYFKYMSAGTFANLAGAVGVFITSRVLRKKSKNLAASCALVFIAVRTAFAIVDILVRVPNAVTNINLITYCIMVVGIAGIIYYAASQKNPNLELPAWVKIVCLLGAGYSIFSFASIIPLVAAGEAAISNILFSSVMVLGYVLLFFQKKLGYHMLLMSSGMLFTISTREILIAALRPQGTGLDLAAFVPLLLVLIDPIIIGLLIYKPWVESGSGVFAPRRKRRKKGQGEEAVGEVAETKPSVWVFASRTTQLAESKPEKYFTEDYCVFNVRKQLSLPEDAVLRYVEGTEWDAPPITVEDGKFYTEELKAQIMQVKYLTVTKGYESDSVIIPVKNADAIKLPDLGLIWYCVQLNKGQNQEEAS